MTTRQIERRAQDSVVRVYRDRFGYPRIEQPDEVSRTESACIALACFGLVLLTLWCAF